MSIMLCALQWFFLGMEVSAAIWSNNDTAVFLLAAFSVIIGIIRIINHIAQSNKLI